MRYPLPLLNDKGDYKPGVMQRLRWLFKYIGLQDKLIDYFYTSDKSPGFLYYNGIRVCVSVIRATSLLQHWASAGPTSPLAPVRLS